MINNMTDYWRARDDFLRQYATPFPAVILAQSSGLYAWQELQPSSSGSLTTYDGGRTGTCFSGAYGAPAVELNGRYVPPMTVVRLTERCDVQGVTWFDFSFAGDLGYPATPFNSGELVVSSGSSQVSVMSGYTFGIFPASGTASGYSASGYGFYVGVPFIFALYSGLEVVTAVCPIYETVTSGSLPYVDSSGEWRDLVTGASGTVPTSDGSGNLTFSPPSAGTPSLTSGSVRSGHIGDNAVVSGSVASGQLDWPHFRSGLLSGLILSGQIGSGQIDWVHARSGLFSGLILSGQIGSGQLDWPHFRSGFAVSGLVLSGGLGSGQVGIVHLASGTLSNVTLQSGTVLSGNIASGQVGGFHLSSGAVTSGRIASGQIGVNHLQSGLVSGLILSGQLGSGQVGVTHLQSGLVTSGLYLSGSIGSGQIGVTHLQSGLVTSGRYLSGSIGSGQIGVTHLQSGLTTSGLYLSGSIGSGQIGRPHLSSGAGVTADTSVAYGAFTGSVYQVLSGGANGAWASSDGTSTLPSVTLPGPGLYSITAYGRVALTPTAANTNAYISLRLFDTTAGVVVSGSESMGLLNNTANRIDVNAIIVADLYATSGHVVQMQALRDNTAAGTLGYVASDGAGRTVLSYHRLA